MTDRRDREREGLGITFNFLFLKFFSSQLSARSSSSSSSSTRRVRYTRSIVAHRPGRPVANAAHGIERQSLGARVLPSEQRAVFRFGTRYEFLTGERVREASHVQTLDVTVAVYAHFAFERHPLFTRVGRLFRFRVVGVLFPRVVVQVLRGGRWRPDSGRPVDHQRRSGPGRSSSQHERLSRRGRRYGGRVRRRERVIRTERRWRRRRR